MARRSLLRRGLSGLALAAFSLGATARAEPVRWSEADVVRMARERDPAVRVSREEADLARAEAAAAGRPPDPALELYREQVFGEGDPSQDVFSVTLPVDLSGRRRGERALARADVARARAASARAEREAIARALYAFYQAIAAKERVEIAEERLDALREVARVLELREEAGAASGLERTRLELEAELVRSDLASRRARERESRARLVALVAPEVERRPALEGELKTREPPPLAELVAQLERRHPGLRHARSSEAAAAEAREAARSAWIPILTLTGGYNRQSEDRTLHGYVVSVGMDLPVFSGDRGLGARAAARQRVADARARALTARLRRRLTRARARLAAARQERARFEEATADRVRALLRGARVSYREGRRPLRELLDAQRFAGDVRDRIIELALEAKRAEVAVRHAAGEW